MLLKTNIRKNLVKNIYNNSFNIFKMDSRRKDYLLQKLQHDADVLTEKVRFIRYKINKKIILGFGGYGIATPIKFDGIDPAESLEIYVGYGGIMTGYIWKPIEAFHLTIPFFAGVGGLSVDEADFSFNPDDPFYNKSIENTTFVVIQSCFDM